MSVGMMGYVLGCWVVASIAFHLGRWRQRRADQIDPENRASHQTRLDAALAQKAAAGRQADRAESRLKTLDALLVDYGATVKKLTQERDAYRAAAESHEVKWPVPVDRSEVVQTKVWADRPYRSTIGENFKLLAEDLKEFSGKTLTLSVTIQAEGGAWFEYMGNKKWWDGRLFTGTPERIVHEFELALSNSKSSGGGYPFIKANTVKDWAGGMAPIRFGLDLWIREPAASATKPLVQLVPQVQTRTEVQVIEVPVFEERVVEKIVPRDLTDAEIDAIVKARVEVELATAKTL